MNHPIAVTLTADERDRLCAFIEDDIFCFEEEADLRQGILDILNPDQPLEEDYILDVLQWHELCCFLVNEAMGSFETTLHGKITDAIEAYAEAEDAIV